MCDHIFCLMWEWEEWSQRCWRKQNPEMRKTMDSQCHRVSLWFGHIPGPTLVNFCLCIRSYDKELRLLEPRGQSARCPLYTFLCLTSEIKSQPKLSTVITNCESRQMWPENLCKIGNWEHRLGGEHLPFGDREHTWTRVQIFGISRVLDHRVWPRS